MAMSFNKNARATRLPPDVNRILFVRNLPFKISSDELYDLFGRYGPIFQIRLGSTTETRGTAFVVFEDIYDSKNACEHLSGFNILGRYLIVLYYQQGKSTKKTMERREKDLETKKKVLQDMTE